MDANSVNRRKHLARQDAARYKLNQFLEANPCVNLIEYGPESVSGFSPEKMMFDDSGFQFGQKHPKALFTISLSLPEEEVRRLLSSFEGADWFWLGLETLPDRWLKISIDTSETVCLRSIIQSVRGFILIPAHQKSAFGIDNFHKTDRYTVLHKPLEPPVLYPCPCCGYLVFKEDPGSDDICPVCYWEDSVSELRFATRGGGANRASLFEAQLNYVELGTSELEYKGLIQSSISFERDGCWRLIDLEIDNIELSSVGDQGKTYPKDRTTLYYWRDTYWRRT